MVNNSVNLFLLLQLSLALYFSLKYSFIQDDAFISFRYSKNLVNGHGLVYNPGGEKVEGYTNFSWVLLMALAMKLGLDPVNASKTIGIISYLLMIVVANFLCYWLIVKNKNQRVGWLTILPLIALLLIPLNKSSASWATGGLETSFFTLLVVAAFVLVFLLEDIKKPSFWLGFNILLIILCLTRPEGIFFAAMVNVYAWWRLHSSDSSWWRSAIEIIKRNLLLIFALLIYVGWKIIYYRSILPNTFYVKGTENLFGLGLTYFYYYLKSYPYLIVSFLVVFCQAVVILFRHWKQKNKTTNEEKLYFVLVVSIIIFLIYVIRIGGDYLEYRPLTYIYPLLIISSCLLTILWLGRKNYFDAAAFLLLSWALMIIPVSHLQYPSQYGVVSTETLYEQQFFYDKWGLIGVALKKILPKDTIISTITAGAIPYYSDLFTIDQFGLNDWEVAHGESTTGMLKAGHRKGALGDYLLRRGVNLMIDYPTIYPCDHPRVYNPWSLNAPNVFIRIDGNNCLRTLYLTPKDSLSKYFKSHPEQFIVRLPPGVK